MTQLLIANHADGSQTLVTIWDDGSGEVATREDRRHTWGIPTELEVAP